ncbi:hypothetical protein BG418_34740 [Streptomyces sp. CBMA152]|nr:hypothetical protein [Streptomyces sp. CBMA152]
MNVRDTAIPAAPAATERAVGAAAQLTVTWCAPAVASGGTVNDVVSVPSAAGVASASDSAVPSHDTRAAPSHRKPLPDTPTCVSGLPWSGLRVKSGSTCGGLGAFT